MSTPYETASIMDAAFNAAVEHIRSDHEFLADPRDGTKAPFAIDKNGIAVVDASAWDNYRQFPLYRKGTARLSQLGSFIDLVNRFKESHSAIFANDDFNSPSLTAIFDYHPDNNDEQNPHHTQAMRHRAAYAFPLSKEWQSWIGSDGKPMSMGDFARFIEDNIVDVSADPMEAFAQASQDFVKANRGTLASPSKLVEISRGLQIYERAVIREAKNLSTGEAQFTFDSEHTDGDGKPLTLPNMFSITLPIFTGSVDVFRLIARFRYRKTGDGLLFWYELWRPDLTFETAFNEAVEQVSQKTALPIFAGAPEAA